MRSTFIGHGIVRVAGKEVSFTLSMRGKDLNDLKMTAAFGDGSRNEFVKNLDNWDLYMVDGTQYEVVAWSLRPLSLQQVAENYYRSPFPAIYCGHIGALRQTVETTDYQAYSENVKQSYCLICKQITSKEIATKVDGKITIETISIKSFPELYKTNTAIVFIFDGVYRVEFCPYVYHKLDIETQARVDRVLNRLLRSDEMAISTVRDLQAIVDRSYQCLNI